MVDAGIDFLSQYRIISNKLKKRFLRKPNVAEACEQFSKLAKDLQQQECPHYAAFCCLALARCEQTLGNPAGETQALIHGARLFLEAERLTQKLNCPSLEDHLNAAIYCYTHAIRIHIEQKHVSLAAALCLELGNVLIEMKKPLEAITHFQRGAELFSNSSLEHLHALDSIASCRIKVGDFDEALNIFTEMSAIVEGKGSNLGGKPGGAFQDLLIKCEIYRVLLLLLLQPTPQRLRPEHCQLLEKYTWDNADTDSAVNYLSEDLFLLLQSFVMASQSHDLDALKTLQIDLWPLLSVEQNSLLHEIVLKANKTTG